MQPLKKIAGLDCSSSSPALVVLNCEPETLDIVSWSFKAITQKKKQKTSKDLAFFDSKDFKDYINKYSMIGTHILDEANDLDYVGIEDYAFAATGRITLLAEICGFYKYELYNHNAKLRLYAPPSWKKCFTGYGHADKITIWQEYLKRVEKGDIADLIKENELPECDKGSGVAPTSDIIDALGLAETMRIELKVRKGMTGGLEKHQLETFRLSGKVKPADLADAYQNREFLSCS